tara:strand:- start:844 stop:1074 length:231 start_codon:yes stop_codon:yes gene_type:complete
MKKHANDLTYAGKRKPFKKDSDYLIQCDYEVFCQGYEWARQQLILVRAKTFEEACEKIKSTDKYRNACDFESRTIE